MNTTPATDRQQRARKGKACMLTNLNASCGKADEVEVEGVSLRLCPLHLHNLLAIVADSKKKDRRHRRSQRIEEAVAA